MDSFRSYPKINPLGHKIVQDILVGHDPMIGRNITVEEKYDGSQFSFGVDTDGNIAVRSRGVVMDVKYPSGMFKKACEWVEENVSRLHPDWTYRAEFFGKPKQNVLAYDRIPKHGLMILDINTAHEAYLEWPDKASEADRLDLEVAALIAGGPSYTTEMVNNWTYDTFRSWLQLPSKLGGQLVEGIVIKNYFRFSMDGHVLMAKYVSEQFKEAHNRLWTKESKGSMLERLIACYKTEARWMKAVQHLRERGELLGDPRDIGNLFKEVQQDFEEEEGERVAQLLFKEFRKDLMRGITKGMPDWYKDSLARQQWEPKDFSYEDMKLQIDERSQS